MSKEVITDALILIGEHDVSGHHSQVAVSYGADTPEATAMGDDTHVMAGGGLHTVGWSGEGYWEASADNERPDLTYHERVGASAVPVTIGKGKGGGDRAYLLDGGLGSYTPLDGGVGDVHTFAIEGYAASELIRATLMEYTPVTEATEPLVTGSGENLVTDTGENLVATVDSYGSARHLGQVGSDQQAHAALFVISASGTDPSLHVAVESAPTSDFASPTTRIRFPTFGQPGTAWLTADGAITDEYWRVIWTLGGTDPEFEFAVVFGIQ